MEIVSFKVSQYRSISGEISSDNFNGLTIVGQNNSGKTNLLKAMRVFLKENLILSYMTMKKISHMVLSKDKLVLL
ncbi:hypothetical protein SEEE6211_23010 [Salmonella enterica subsp. enterica serovar Enteritidis str. 561362 1-1]|uniref:AAA family ATPase n=1 Tax=Salmonella enterica TaxID=28901 RepID=UPI0002736AE8|nr:AAA family ATPase [Salmonella enterica]EJI73862.1 hypothetical protein SEEE1618_15736 [Salmonella enterica subsp. enterica serovar Enteritidis str. 648901 6-18]ELN16589.1 hypothetical protein SEEE0819_02111 [Salmonella enterica subsp. enterica serovar Enteritidis str. 607308-19]ELN97292.1 hypothetical protein SEEE6211_23010 [Salmonella enterica subsp. enterica serovar Enteritidis str. 561362 1-1]